MEKTIVGRFLHGRPNSAPTLAHLRVRAGLPARYRATVADRWGPPVGAVFPQSPLLRARVISPAKFPSPPHATRMVACSPATLSHRVGCSAPWCPITAAHLHLPSSPLCRSDSGADRWAMKSSSRPLCWPSFHCRMHAVEAIV
jgi:hypothetical protein